MICLRCAPLHTSPVKVEDIVESAWMSVKIRQQTTTKRNMEKIPCEIVPQIHCRRFLDEKSEELRGNFPGCYLAMDHGLLGGRSHIQSSESR